jgi:biopolymer transport protein ExbB
MIGLVFFNGLHNRVRLVVHQLDTLKMTLVNRMTSNVADDEVAREMETEAPRAVVAALAQQGA